MSQAKPKAIRRKDSIPENVRTPGKDDAAAFIQTEVIEKGRWPMDYTEIADESGWSRQHIVNTLDDYYVEVTPGDTETRVGETDGNGLKGRTLTIPDDVENVSDYLRGVQAGLEL